MLQVALKKHFGYYLLLAGNTDLSQVETSPVNHHFALRQKKRIGFDGVVSDYTAMPFDSDSLDVIVLTHALSHCAEPKVVLKEMNRVLRHDGTLIITGFNPIRALARKMWQHQARSHDADGKMQSLAMLEFFLNKSGFELMQKKRFGMLPYSGKTARTIDAIGLKFMRCFACGYLLVVQKRTIRLTPLRYETPVKAKSRVVLDA